MSTTDDPNDPGLRDIGPDGMQRTYLVLSDEERAKGFVRPVRRTYVHVGIAGPTYPLLDLTLDQIDRYGATTYAKWEPYPTDAELVDELQTGEQRTSALGRLWTQDQLDRVGSGCGAATRMGVAIAETYAREPGYYGGTYCVRCCAHFPVGEDGEFVWDGTDERVGT